MEVSHGDFFAVMYHYVRPPEHSKLKSLNVENFSKQLDFFENNYGIIDQKDWENFRKNNVIPSGVLLTFDDGLKDHIQWVLPELIMRNLFAIFYVCTNPINGSALPVHLAHYLLAHNDAGKLVSKLLEITTEENISLEEKARIAYVKQDSDGLTKYFKRLINWQSTNKSYYNRLNDLFCEFGNLSVSEFISKWYLNEKDIGLAYEAGIEIGSHTCSHNLLSNLSTQEVEFELRQSKYLLSDLINSEVRSFCYPFGGKNSYNDQVIKHLNNLKYLEAVSVDPRPINYGLNSTFHRYEIPRYDCNLFPFGQSI